MAEKAFRLTRQRRAILEELRRVRCHPAADQVYAMVRRRLPRVSLGTVYRNLDSMTRSGLVRRLDVGSGSCRFDGTTKPHDHAVCAVCGRVDDVSEPALRVDYDAAGAATGYAIRTHRLQFVGLCPSCRRRRGAGRADGGWDVR
jgi:Fur family ferric uptake transcriptional regulator